MAYDDDDKFGFRDPRDWLELLQSFFSLPEHISIVQLSQTLQVLGDLAAQKDVRELSIFEVDQALRKHKMSGLPVDVTTDLLEAVAPIARKGKGKVDVLSQLTLKEIAEILSRARNR